jgi:Mor family transcriptional regulator
MDTTEKNRFIEGAERETILADYASGMSTTHIATKYRRQRRNIIRFLRREGVFEARPKCNTKLTPEIEAVIAADYQAGGTYPELRKKYGVTSALLRKALQRRGVDRRSKGARIRVFVDDAKRALELHAAGASVDQIVEQLGFAPEVARRICIGEFNGVPESAALHRAGAMRCGKCREWRRLDQFNTSTTAVRGKVGLCRACESNYNRENSYGVTPEQYAVMVEQHRGVCAICHTFVPTKSHPTLCVDHDHVTGAVRGLLCPACNISIGRMNDDPSRLRAAADYIDRCRANTSG